MNPETNKFEQLKKMLTEGTTASQLPQNRAERRKLADMIRKGQATQLVRPDGSSVPAHWPIFSNGEHVVIKDYTFRVAYIGETAILFEPVGIPEVGRMERERARAMKTCERCGAVIDNTAGVCPMGCRPITGEWPTPPPLGWRCPVCGGGNAPWVARCPCVASRKRAREAVWGDPQPDPAGEEKRDDD